MSIDIKAIIRCPHKIYGATYGLQECPRCQGKGWYGDFDIDGGSFALVNDISKLIQQLVMITLTTQTTDKYNPTYGTRLLSLVGKPSNPTRVREIIKSTISDAIQFLIQQQQVQEDIGQLLTDDEQIISLDGIEVFNVEPTEYTVRVSVATKGGPQEPINFSIKVNP